MDKTRQPDVIEAGDGPPVVLIHSSVAGARQWRHLMGHLAASHRTIAPNLYGYGTTPPWPGQHPQRLEDQAALIAGLLPEDRSPVSIVGHSFGGSVAMKLAAMNPGRVARLVLIEPNPFTLLREANRSAAFDDAMRLCETIRGAGVTGDWAGAAETFADYWTGPGSWAAMSEDRRAKFATALRPNLHEWDAILGERTTAAEWVAALPTATTVITANDTVRTIAEIAELLAAAAPDWRFETLPEGGHMAALTKPDSIAPLIERALR